MERVLEGIKVLEVSAWAFVPSAGAVLADWGADVVKVEPPTGDPLRGLVNAGIGAEGGPSFPWEAWNRGKRSIALDLKHPDARAIVLKAAAEADVFLTSYLPQTRRKLGLDIDDIRAVNPSIVYGCGTGQGSLGEESEKGGYDAISFWARGGVGSIVTPPGAERPIGQPGGAFGDSLSGMALAGGIAAALVRRARTGEGAVVDVALLGHCDVVLADAHRRRRRHDVPCDRRVRRQGHGQSGDLQSSWSTTTERRTAGGSRCACSSGTSIGKGFLVALGRQDLLSDERFANARWL